MFQKVFSDIWLCSWKYHRKHIFYLLLTFSRLPNEYIISFIPQNTNKTKKKIIKSGQTKARLRSQSMPIGAVSGSFSLSCCVCSLSVFCCVLFAECVSLFYACYGKCLKVKRFRKMISGSTSANFGQTEIIFWKIYFP